MPYIESPLTTPSSENPPQNPPPLQTRQTAERSATSSHTPPAPLTAIFTSLHGTWTLHRRLTSTLPHYPSGTFTGLATFSRSSSLSSSGPSYLYHETGELKTDAGVVLRANQKYLYHHDLENEKLSVWFVKPDAVEAEEEVDYLYMEIEMAENEDVEGAWVGKGDHLCEMDMYWGFFDWRLDANGDGDGMMRRFGIKYKVKGPSKDYLSETAYVKRDGA